jgi:cholera toxin transcriptional activator
MPKLSVAMFDFASETLIFGERTVKLNSQVAACLQLLIARHGEIVSKDDILTACWTERGIVVSDASVRQVLFQLRKALNAAGLDPGCLTSVQRQGYRLKPGSILPTVRGVSVKDTPATMTPYPVPDEQAKPDEVASACDHGATKGGKYVRRPTPWLLKLAVLTLSICISFWIYHLRTAELTEPLNYEFVTDVEGAGVYFQQGGEIDKVITLHTLRSLIDKKYIFPALNKFIYVNQTYSNNLATFFICRAPLSEPDSRCYSLIAEDWR